MSALTAAAAQRRFPVTCGCHPLGCPQVATGSAAAAGRTVAGNAGPCGPADRPLWRRTPRGPWRPAEPVGSLWTTAAGSAAVPPPTVARPAARDMPSGCRWAAPDDSNLR
jgi:hypothetical protein